MSAAQPSGKSWLQLPFDLYDFFGYLFPGLVFVICLGILVVDPPSASQLPPLIQSVTDGLHGTLQWWEGALLLLAVVVILYAAGHFIASASAIILDRILLGGVLGYPYKRQLGMPCEIARVGKACYEYLFVIGNSWIVMLLVAGRTTWTNLASLLLLMLAMISMIPKIVQIVARHGENVVADEGRFTAAYTWLAEKVLDRLLDIFKRLARLDKEFSEPVRKSIASGFRSRFKEMEIEKVETDAFWLTYDSVAQRSAHHAKAIMNFVHMFSFARNLCAAMVIPVVVACLHETTIRATYNGFNRPLAASLFVVGWVMMWRYYYLFSRYYTEYTFRAFVALNAEE